MIAVEPKKAVLNAAVRLIGPVGEVKTGLSRYSRNLLAALQALGVSVAVGSAHGPYLPSAVRHTASRLNLDFNSFFTTYPVGLSKFPQANITHITSQNLASAAAFRKPNQLIITVHDLITLVYRRNPELAGHMHFYDRAFDDLAVMGLKKADALIADSEQTKRDIIQFCSYPAHKIKVISLGIDHSRFKPLEVTPSFFNRFGLNPEVSYILNAGSEDPRKNLRRLFEAFSRVLKELPDVRLLKVGSARFEDERKKLLEYATNEGIADKIHFIGPVSDEDLACFYNLAKVFVFPSLYEGFGLPPLEAMACGTPVVVSNSSSLPEVVGNAGLTVDPYDVKGTADAMLKTLTDQVLGRNLRQQGLEQALKFSWERTAAETLAVYQQLSDGALADFKVSKKRLV